MVHVPSESTALLADAGTESIRRTISRDSYNKPYGTADEEEGQDGIDPNSEIETTWQKEVFLLAQYAAPLILTYGLQYSYSLLIVYMSGHIGPEELAAASISTMTANITGMVVYESLATCLDTLTSQAYGNGNKKMVGLHVQRMIVMCLLATVPIGVLWMFSPYYLEKMIPEQHIAHLAGRFLRIYLIGAPGYGVFESAKRFTQAQGNFTIPLVVAIVCAPLNIFWNWLFVVVSPLPYTPRPQTPV